MSQWRFILSFGKNKGKKINLIVNKSYKYLKLINRQTLFLATDRFYL